MRVLLPALLAGTSLFASTPALAQSDMAELQQQIAAMQAEIARLSGEVARLQAAQDLDEGVPATEPGTTIVEAQPASVAPAATPEKEQGMQVKWSGAPEISAPGGWSFKARGRLQVDAATISAPNDVNAGDGLGFGSEFRRAYLGVDGTLPGNFGYRIEADFAPSTPELTDVFLTYKPASGMTLTVGHHKPFNGMEDLTSDLFTSMLERAAFNSAFNFGRRVGVSGTYDSDSFLLQGGLFTANLKDLNDDGNNSYSVDARAVFKPKVGKGRLHFGGSAHFRDLNDSADFVRYRARPFFHTTDVRLVDTGLIPATGERSFGVELAYIQGPFHATVEGFQMTTLRPGQSNPDFRGGYGEIGMLLTGGDTTAYRAGIYDRIRPTKPVSAGGIGAIQVNVRYDTLDLNDEDVIGGTQDALGLSAIWIPESYVRFMLNYGHLWIADAAIPSGADPDYQVDTVGMRAQFDF